MGDITTTHCNYLSAMKMTLHLIHRVTIVETSSGHAFRMSKMLFKVIVHQIPCNATAQFLKIWTFSIEKFVVSSFRYSLDVSSSYQCQKKTLSVCENAAPVLNAVFRLPFVPDSLLCQRVGYPGYLQIFYHQKLFKEQISDTITGKESIIW